jgi:flagellar motility protein MotE (MotC chaperone)
MLIFILLTGIIPFRPPPEPVYIKEPLVLTRQIQIGTNDAAAIGATPIYSTLGTKAADELLASLKAEKEQLAKKAAELATKEDLQGKLKAELIQLQQALDKQIVEIQAIEQVNLKKLSDMYGKMDPAGAAKLLIEMDKEKAATILSLMSDRSAAAILDNAVQEKDKGTAAATAWTDIIRRMEARKKEKTK